MCQEVCGVSMGWNLKQTFKGTYKILRSPVENLIFTALNVKEAGQAYSLGCWEWLSPLPLSALNSPLYSVSTEALLLMTLQCPMLP